MQETQARGEGLWKSSRQLGLVPQHSFALRREVSFKESIEVSNFVGSFVWVVAAIDQVLLHGTDIEGERMRADCAELAMTKPAKARSKSDPDQTKTKPN